jgi:hypothetical protein
MPCASPRPRLPFLGRRLRGGITCVAVSSPGGGSVELLFAYRISYTRERYSETVDSREVWYVGYGSNLDENRLDKYLLDRKTIGHNTSWETRWIELEYHQIYFAGKSKTWNGAVAFCALKSEQPRPFPVKAHRLQLEELSVVAAKENGYSSIAWDPASAFDLEINEWLPLPVALAKDGFAGKYNAILRLPDIDGIRAFTLSTSHVLPIDQPASAYLELIVAALTNHIGAARAHSLLQKAVSTGLTDNRVFVGCDPRKGLVWKGVAEIRPELGIPIVQLRLSESGTQQSRSLQLGTLESNGSKT